MAASNSLIFPQEGLWVRHSWLLLGTPGEISLSALLKMRRKYSTCKEERALSALGWKTVAGIGAGALERSMVKRWHVCVRRFWRWSYWLFGGQWKECALNKLKFVDISYAVVSGPGVSLREGTQPVGCSPATSLRGPWPQSNMGACRKYPNGF